jgi:hypothetical protein
MTKTKPRAVRLKSAEVRRVLIARRAQDRTSVDLNDLAARLSAPSTRNDALKAVRQINTDGEITLRWNEPPLRDVVRAMLREGDDELEHFALTVHGPPPELVAAFRERLGSPDVAVQANAFDYLCREGVHLDEAIAWLERVLHARQLSGFGASPRFGVRALFDRDAPDTARVRDLVGRYLVRGPKRPTPAETDWELNAVWRELLEDNVDRLSPDELESVAARTLEALDGVARAHTRYVLWTRALPPLARAIGTRALPWVVAALREELTHGLPALEALGSARNIDRAKALSEVMPVLASPEALRWPAHVLGIAAALRPLAGGQSPEAIGVPPAVAKVWNEVSITEDEVLDAIVEDGVAASRARLASRDSRDRLVGSDLVIDVLCRAGLATQFDAECGFFPVRYAELLRETIVPLLSLEAPVTASVEVERNDAGAAYRLALVAGDIGVSISFSDESDYYDVPAVVALANALFEACGAARRIIPLRTPDQTAILVCGPPTTVQAFARRYGIKTTRF